MIMNIKQRKMKIEPRIKLYYNIAIKLPGKIKCLVITLIKKEARITSKHTNFLKK